MNNLARSLGQGFVNAVFTGVHNNYDKANDAMSFFLHRKWKKNFVNMLGVSSESNVLDVACGTGDITRLLLKKTQNVTMADINSQMLEVAKNKVGNGVNAVVCDAAKMPFENETFDFITCVFGIRNFQEIEKAIEEFRRVLKPNGTLAIMEFLPNASGGLQNKLYHVYLQKILPNYDKIFKNEEQSYKYLADSILAFPSKNEFKQTLQNGGFSVITPRLMQETVGIFLCSKNV